MKYLFLVVFTFFFIAAVFGTAGCGKKTEQQQQQGQQQSTPQGGNQQQSNNPLEQMAKAADEMTKSMSGDQKPVPPVPYKSLQAFLPPAMGDMTTKGPEGESATMGEWSYSQAKIVFSGKTGEEVRVEIFDYAHISMLYAPFQMAWNMKISKESSEGYERTTKVGSWPAFEKWEVSNKAMEVNVLVGDRFIVSVHTTKLGEGSAKDILSKMDLNKLSMQKAS